MRTVFVAAVVCLLGAAGPVLAQTALERIEPRLSRAIEEHRVFLTCSRLDPDSSSLVLKGWAQMIAAARAYLQTHYTSLADLAAFDRRTAVETLIAADKPFSDAIALCDSQPDWFKRLSTFDFVFKIDDTPLPSR